MLPFWVVCFRATEDAGPLQVPTDVSQTQRHVLVAVAVAGRRRHNDLVVVVTTHPTVVGGPAEDNGLVAAAADPPRHSAVLKMGETSATRRRLWRFFRLKRIGITRCMSSTCGGTESFRTKCLCSFKVAFFFFFFLRNQ